MAVLLLLFSMALLVTSKLEVPLMASCCNYDADIQAEGEWRQVMECTHKASEESNGKLLAQKGEKGVKRFGIVTFATKNIWDYTAYSFAVNQVYAENNGHILKNFDEDSPFEYDLVDSRWNKVKIMEQALNEKSGWAKDLDYILWVDADLVFMDMELNLQQLVEQHAHAHVLVSAEHAGSTTLMNSGCVIVRNSAFGKAFLEQWWEFSDRSLYSDQEQFDMLYKYHLDRDPKSSKSGERGGEAGERNIELLDVQSSIVILPPDAINSDPPAMTQQKPHNQVLHLMGEHTAFRAKTFRSGLNEICRAISASTSTSDSSSLKPQLGLDKEHLLQWTLETYGKESTKALEECPIGSAKGEYGVAATRHIANAVHHYAHALQFSSQLTGSGGEDQFQRAVLARGQAYECLRRNMRERRRLNPSGTKPSKVAKDWPELLKIVAEAGQQLLSFDMIPPTARMEIAQEVLGLLDEMTSVCHVDQRRAVSHMIAHMHSEVGLLHLNQKDMLRSLHEFHNSLQVYRNISYHTGTHILVSPLIALANALATTQHFQQAFPLYTEAISISEGVLGEKHESLVQPYLNFGIALVQSGRYDAADIMLLKAQGLFEANYGPGQEAVTGDRIAHFTKLAKKREGSLGLLSLDEETGQGDRKTETVFYRMPK